ncbi:acyl-CoA thioesterase II [soil metagenome]
MDAQATTELSIGDLVRVEPSGPLSFVGQPYRTARGAVFGGQLLGQALSAAGGTNEGFPWPTSLQVYFIAAPDPTRPIQYDVTIRRDGGRFAWRHVLGTQGGRLILEAMAAFQSVPTPAAPQPLPEDLLRPDELEDVTDLVLRHGEAMRHYYDRIGVGTMDTRFVQGAPPLRIQQGKLDPWHQIWIKPLNLAAMGPTEMGCVLAYLSDVNMLATPMLPFASLGDGVKDYASSFDHNVRFYTPVEVLDWLVFDQRSNTDSGSTLEARGSLVTEGGMLVCTVNQQGLKLNVKA